MPSFSNITITEYFTRDGDYNQEDIDNKSPMVWADTMPAGTTFLLFYFMIIYIIYLYIFIFLFYVF